MSETKYNVLSPDGFPISCEPFASEKEARAAIRPWVKRFKKQGYYSTANRERIPFKEFRHNMKVFGVVPVREEDAYPACDGSCRSDKVPTAKL